MVAGCHTHTSPSTCCSVRLSHQFVEKCGLLWNFCLGMGSDSIVESTLLQVRCAQCSMSACAVLTCFSSVTEVHFCCLHLLHAMLSLWTHEVGG